MTENKTYTYKGLSFRLKPNSLELFHKAAPLMIRYRKLHWEHTKDIDMTTVERARSYIMELETAIGQLETGGAEEKSKAEEISAKLQVIKEEFDNNHNLQSLIKLYNDCESLVMYELITDTELIKPFLCSVLESSADSSGRKGDINKLDFTDDSMFEFIKEVVLDFFSFIVKSSLG